LPLLLKQTLRLSQVQRQLEATARDTWLLPSSGRAVKAGMEAGVEYDRLVWEEGANHKRGPPHPYILLAFIEAAATVPGEDEEMEKEKEKAPKAKDKRKDKDKETSEKDEEDKGKEKEVRDAAMNLYKILETTSLERVADLIPYFRLNYTFKPEIARVEVSINPLPLGKYEGTEAEGAHLAMMVRATIHRIVEAEGGTRKVGAAPRPAMERALQGELMRLSRRSG